MALNYSANQYDRAFNPRKLCNWEIPRKESALPKRRIGTTRIIVNDKGHLLPGIKKLNPWSHFQVQTYRSPDKKSKIQKPDDKMGHTDDILTTWEKRSSHVPITGEQSSMLSLSCPIISQRSSIHKETESQQTRNEHQELDASINRRSSIDKMRESSEGAPLEHSSYQDLQVEKMSHRSDRSNRDDNLSRPASESSGSRISRLPSTTNEPLLINAYCNGLVAKNLKYNNQKHHILADAVDYALRKNSESNLDAWVPTVGCKIFQSPGPTQCSKLTVFRPKSTTKNAEHKEDASYDHRPQTAPRYKDLSDIDLAIYWDITDRSMEKELKNNDLISEQTSSPGKDQVNQTENGLKKNKIIDNQMKSSDRETNQSDYAIQIENAQIENQNESQEKNIDKKSLIKTENMERRLSVESNSERECKLGRSSSQTRQSITNLVEETSKTKSETLSIKHKKLYASAPNLMDIGIQVNPNFFKTKARKCDACDVKQHYYKPSINTERYKLAFKAGKPNALAVDANTLERLHKARHIHVPKPKMPYAKKNYSIGTLMPPFSVWPRVVGQDYPDHWRLASVYQHSYKPLNTRKPMQEIREAEDGVIHRTNVLFYFHQIHHVSLFNLIRNSGCLVHLPTENMLMSIHKKF